MTHEHNVFLVEFILERASREKRMELCDRLVDHYSGYDPSLLVVKFIPLLDSIIPYFKTTSEIEYLRKQTSKLGEELLDYLNIFYSRREVSLDPIWETYREVRVTCRRSFTPK